MYFGEFFEQLTDFLIAIDTFPGLLFQLCRDKKLLELSVVGRDEVEGSMFFSACTSAVLLAAGFFSYGDISPCEWCLCDELREF